MSLKENLITGVAFICGNLGLSIKMAFYFGLVISLLGIVVYNIAGINIYGMFIAIILTAFIGAVINKAVLEVYREISTKRTMDLEGPQQASNSSIKTKGD